MNLLSLYNDNNNKEVQSYFRSEYKNDWEYAYSAYLDHKKGKRKNFFRTIFSTLFHTHKGD